MKELAKELGLVLEGAEVEKAKQESSNNTTGAKEEQKEKIANINVQAVKEEGPKVGGGESLGSQQVQVVQTDSGEILLVTCEAGQEREAAGLAYDDEVSQNMMMMMMMRCPSGDDEVPQS